MRHALPLFAILSFAYASSAAAAPNTASNPTPHADACRPTGAVLFEIDHRVDPGAKLPTSTTKVFANGAWTYDETDADGKAAPQRMGCLAKPDVKQLETALHSAPWETHISRICCLGVQTTSTVFQVGGKPVFTQWPCPRESLDHKSRATLDAATKLVKSAVNAAQSRLAVWQPPSSTCAETTFLALVRTRSA